MKCRSTLKTDFSRLVCRALLHATITAYLTTCTWTGPGHSSSLAAQLGDECSGRGLCEVCRTT